MDYKELANLIFPDAKEISYYEEKYKRRNLPEGAEVLRVAPSPTGNVHIGTIYQALVAKKLTKQTDFRQRTIPAYPKFNGKHLSLTKYNDKKHSKISTYN